MKYKINKKGQIIKSDFEIIYNQNDYANALQANEKKLTEAEAQKTVYKAKMDNVARNNPNIEKMSEDDRNRVWLYQENHIAVVQVDEAIKALKKNIKSIKEEIKDIEKQTGLKI